MPNGALKERLLVDDGSNDAVSCMLLLHVFVAAVSGLVSGYNLCAISSILAPVEHSLQLCGPGSTACPAKQLAVSATPIGAIVGGLLGGSMSDRYGRRAGMQITDVFCIIGAASMSAATPGMYATLFFVGRFFVGMAAAAAVAISNIYIAELSPISRRGSLCAINELAVCIGCLLAYIAAIVFGDEGWHWTCSASGAGALIQLLLLNLLVESPAWLLSRQRSARGDIWATDEHAARKSARTLGLGEDSLLAMQELAAAARDRRVPTMDSLRLHGRSLLLGSGLATAHALTAANTVLYYSRDILQSVGVADPVAANLAVGCLKFLGAAAAMVIVDRFDRRLLLAHGALLMCAGHFALALSRTSAVSLAALLLIIFAWSASWAGVWNTVTTELLPQSVRGVGTGIATAVFWVLSFLLSQTLESAFATLGEAAIFAAFGTTTAAAACFVWVCVPETKGKQLT